MRRKRLRQSLRTLGVDDGYFPINYKKCYGRTLLVVTTCEGLKLSNVKMALITVDGIDGTDVVLSILKSLCNRYDAIFFDGVTYAGFNIVDPERVFNETSIPSIVIFKYKLDLNIVKEALIKNFNDWMFRYSTIERTYNNSYVINTPKGRLRIFNYGLTRTEAYELILNLQNINQYPEPLRLADLIASGLTKGSTLLEIINKRPQAIEET